MVALTTIHKMYKAERSQNLTGWGQKVKIKLFHNLVMVHIKLNEMENAATCKHIFCPYTHPRLLGVVKYKTFFFLLKIVMLHNK